MSGSGAIWMTRQVQPSAQTDHGMACLMKGGPTVIDRVGSGVAMAVYAFPLEPGKACPRERTRRPAEWVSRGAALLDRAKVTRTELGEVPVRHSAALAATMVLSPTCKCWQ